MLTKYLPILFRRTSLLTTYRSIRLSHQTRLDLDQLLERLDGEAHRRGRLNAGLVRGAIKKATNEVSELNPTQALLLIRCTGSLLVSELPRQRQQILDEMMKIFKTKSVQFDVTHYNSYMRVSLQNQCYFDPMKILSEMKMSNIQPNLTSFRLLIECYARQGRSDPIEKLLNEMKNSHFNIESLTLTHLLASYARNGDIERVESLYKLFVELDLKPLSETFEQFVIAYLRHDEIDRAKKFFNENSSKFDNDSLLRLLIETARVNSKEFFGEILRSIDENSLADICVQYVVCATELFELNLDEFAFILIDSFPRRDETLRFDLINLSMLNLMKIRLPSNHLRSFSNESVSDDELKTFEKTLLNRIDFFSDRKDRWLIVHQFLHHAYLNSIPMSYIYLIYEKLRDEQFDYRPHYIRPVLIKFQRIFAENLDEMRNQTKIFLEFLQKTFSIDFDNETIDLLIEHFFDYCQWNPNEIDLLMKKINIRLNVYWSNLYFSTLKRLNRSTLNSLKVFLNSIKTNRFELTSKIRDETICAFESLINRLSLVENSTTIIDELNEILDFIDVFNQRFGKNSSIDVNSFNQSILKIIYRSFNVEITSAIRLKKNFQINNDESTEIFVKTTRNVRTMSIRELEDHLIELKRKKMNPSGIISKLLMKYSSECLDGERTMTKPVRQTFAKRIEELETIYFDKNQTTGFPSLGVIAILIDYYSRVVCNLDKVIFYIQLSNQLDPNFKLDPHKCVSVIRLLIRKDSFEKSIELIDSLGQYENVPNYMYRRVRDLLLDAFHLLKFEQFDQLVQKLLTNHYVDPSSIVLSLIVRKSYEDRGPLHAFETLKKILIQWNNLVGMFPIIRKLLRDDCSEELKQVLIKIGQIRSRTFAYEQLALALIHERRPVEAVRVCQYISRTTFEEHCQRYVRELFFFPSNDDEKTKNIDDPFETEHVYDSRTISLIYFLDYFEQFPSNTQHLNIDTFFFHLLKSYEKANRLDELTKFMRDRSSKYIRSLSTKTKDAFSQAGITLPIKSLTSPKFSNRRSTKTERFLDEKDYEEDQQVVETTT